MMEHTEDGIQEAGVTTWNFGSRIPRERDRYRSVAGKQRRDISLPYLERASFLFHILDEPLESRERA
jgi:hypothetical protein